MECDRCHNIKTPLNWYDGALVCQDCMQYMMFYNIRLYTFIDE
jgi:hypothetical protein